MDDDKIKKYLEMRYPITWIPCEDGGFVVKIEDLPGCVSQGDTVVDAYQMIEDARIAWIVTALERGIDIPFPQMKALAVCSGQKWANNSKKMPTSGLVDATAEEIAA